MNINIKIGKENYDVAEAFTMIYYMFLSIIVMTVYEIPIIKWVIFFALIPFIFLKLTKLKIKINNENKIRNKR